MNTILKAIEQDGCCTINEGTLRSQDLIPKFCDTLKILNEDAYDQLINPANGFSAFPHHAREDENDAWWDSEDCDDLLAQLEMCLGEESPEGFYFGAHEGDGASFGFWPV